MESNSDSGIKQKFNNHLANERTFLAWMRTSAAFIGLGFVVVKFSLFVRQLSSVLDASGKAVSVQKGYSIVIGILLVAIGAVTTILATVRYFRTKRMLETDRFYHSSGLIVWIAATIFIASIFLIGYLLRTT